MKLGGNLPLDHDALLFTISGTGSRIYAGQSIKTDTSFLIVSPTDNNGWNESLRKQLSQQMTWKTGDSPRLSVSGTSDNITRWQQLRTCPAVPFGGQSGQRLNSGHRWWGHIPCHRAFSQQTIYNKHRKFRLSISSWELPLIKIPFQHNIA